MSNQVGDADKWFAEALALRERIQSPPLVACTQPAWAGLLAEGGAPDDRVQALEMAEHALTAATTRGYSYIEADARAVLSQLA